MLVHQMTVKKRACGKSPSHRGAVTELKQQWPRSMQGQIETPHCWVMSCDEWNSQEYW